MSTTAETSPVRPHQIRPATTSDADPVFSLLGQLEPDYVPERGSFDAAFAGAVRAADDNVLLVAVAGDGAVIGYALATLARLFHTKGLSAQLQELVVDESTRGQRVGNQLVAAVERECLLRGARQLTVVSRRNAAFYEGLDYRSTADFLKKSLVS